MPEDNLAKQGNKRTTKVIVALAIIVLVGLFIMVINFFQNEYRGGPEKNNMQTNEKNQSTPFDTLGGTIHLSLAPEGTRLVDLYNYDIKTNTFTKSFGDDEKIRLTGKESANKKMIAYVETSVDTTSNFFYPSKEYFQVEIYDKTTSETKKITNFTDLYKRLGDWSPDDTKIVFTALSDKDNFTEDIPLEDSSFFNPDAWSVYVVDLNGTVTKIDNGTSPLWMPDGKSVIYLKNDGIYAYYFDSQTAEKIYSSVWGDQASTNMKLGISREKNLLALSVPNNLRIYIFQIPRTNLEHTIVISKSEEINLVEAFPFWPVFSPDGRYLVFQESDAKKEFGGVPTNPRLVAYDFEFSKKIVLTDLKQFNFDSAFISYWDAE